MNEAALFTRPDLGDGSRANRSEGPVTIAVEGLSKRYFIGKHSERERYTALRDVLGRSVRGVVRKAGDLLKGGQLIQGDRIEEFWALRELDFQVREGEVLGIIGRNGAGKSSLLKVLSRITEPTQGRVRLRGRVASLLEVGTGFHPELTGRENIFLNGAILGMTRSEIRRKFDEIVDFAGVEAFLDTPVKRYSSGMYVRLAFAVAAHLQSEILVVDEVLAVGDAAFQKKCLDSMGSVAKSGRTVLFVSHLMPAVQSLCTRAILLERGAIVSEGKTSEVVSDYLSSAKSLSNTSLEERVDRNNDGSIKMISVEITTPEGGQVIRSTSRLKITIGYKADGPVRNARFLVGLYDVGNTGIVAFDSDVTGGLPSTLPAEGAVTCITEPLKVTAGRCYVNLAVSRGGGIADHVQRAAFFDVEHDDADGGGNVPGRDWAMCLRDHSWSLD